MTSRGAILNTGSVLRKPRKTVLNLDNYKNVIGKEKYDAGPILVDQFDLSLQLDKQVYTSAKLLVYYEYDDEVISDAIDINIKACTANQVSPVQLSFMSLLLATCARFHSSRKFLEFM